MLKKRIVEGKRRRALLILIDVLVFAVADLMCYLTPVVMGAVSVFELNSFWTNSFILCAFIFAMRFLFSIYSGIWRYTSTKSYFKMVCADIIGACIALVAAYFVCGSFQVWHFGFVTAISLVVTLFSRFVYRLMYKKKSALSISTDRRYPVAIVGAGQLGVLLAEELNHDLRSEYTPVMFVDNDRTKIGKTLCGMKVFGEDDKLAAVLKKYDVRNVLVAINRLDDEQANHLFSLYTKLGCRVKVYDAPVTDFEKSAESDRAHRGTIRDFKIEDLLFRKQINVKNEKTVAFYSGKTVLVTGGGGSIGSEICRQLAHCDIRKLIILDIYENNAYDIQQELIREHGNKLDLSVEIASVRDRQRLEDVFNTYRPDVVFHAAAHKHVPLMEHSAGEAIKNNVLGTYNTADMAEKYGVKKFILVSTDKAVNPTNIMGASKRMCEMVVQCRTDGETAFSAVRFGNVLGSNGSVIPLFRRQIAEGGPITITDKRIIRYFMTIPEASQLVMQAGAMAKKGELFVLDMGKPVRILDLAINMIKMSGYVPDVDIKIEEIGLRPGEKLYEELLMKTETLSKTDNHMIFIERDTPLSREEVEAKLDILRAAVAVCDVENAQAVIKDAIKKVVPTFREPDEVNKTAEDASEMRELAKN